MPNSVMKTVAAVIVACVLATAAQASVNISMDPTSNENCSAGVCTPTDRDANINVGDLQAMLASSDVTVKTGAGAVAIGVTSPLTWASTHRLTLNPLESVHIRAPIVVEGTAGVTILVINSLATHGTRGDYTFNTGTSGAITFWDTNSSLIINGRTYKLESSLPALIKDAAISLTNKSSYTAFALANDYDASADGIYAASPIPAFGRILEGLGHAITNLQVKSSSSDYAGLIAKAGPKSVIRDVGVTNANISGGVDEGALAAWNEGAIINCFASGSVLRGADSAGGLVGYNYNRGTITGSTAAVTVTGSTVGGLVGSTNAQINLESVTYSSASGDVTGDVAGGLIGTTGSDIVSNAHASGQVHGKGLAGGLIGYVESDVLYSYATGDVTGGPDAAAGGLAGQSGVIGWSFATGNVTGGARAMVGGLVGKSEFFTGRSYATGDVKGGPSAYVGGLAGYASDIEMSYSTGRVSGGSDMGGFVGYSDDEGNDPTATYWDVETSGTSTGCGDYRDTCWPVGLTTSQLTSRIPAGFSNDWGQTPDINNGYPYLLANPPPQ